MKRVRNSVAHSIRALAVNIGFCILMSDALAQPANESPDAKPLDICVQALTKARQRVDALARRAQSCRSTEASGGEPVEILRREPDGLSGPHGGRRLLDGYSVPGDQPKEREELSVSEMDSLPDVEACQDVGQALVEAKLTPLRFWVRSPDGQLAQCFQVGDRFTWQDFNVSDSALVIQRGAR